jgi:hypothetical protein
MPLLPGILAATLAADRKNVLKLFCFAGIGDSIEMCFFAPVAVDFEGPGASRPNPSLPSWNMSG